MSDIYKQLAGEIGSQRKPETLVPLLDWPGILEAREAYAAALARSVTTLTEAEKQAAFMNQIMERLSP